METLSLLLVSERKHLENLRKTKEQNIRNTSWLSGCNGQIPVWGRFPEAPKSPIATLVGGIFSKLRLIKHQKFLLAGMFHQRRVPDKMNRDGSLGPKVLKPETLAGLGTDNAPLSKERNLPKCHLKESMDHRVRSVQTQPC